MNSPTVTTLLDVEPGDRLHVTITGNGILRDGTRHTEAEVVVEDVDREPDDDMLSPFVESLRVAGHRPEGVSDGDIEGWELTTSKRASESWLKPNIKGYYYGPLPDDDDVLDYQQTAPIVIDEIRVLDDEDDDSELATDGGEDLEEQTCFRVVTKAVFVDEVVAEDSFHAEQKAKSVYRHKCPAADVSAVKTEEVDAEECIPDADSDRRDGS